MIRRAIAVLATPLLLVMGAAMAAAGGGALNPLTATGDVNCVTATPTGSGIQVAGVALDAAQVANARTIRDVGLALAVPAQGQAVAIATAMTESTLRNLDHGDADSVGLFQQRPSAGWGTVAQLMDPVYSATKFYRSLLAVPDWQTLPLTVAAQRVQRSAFPDRYAAWEPLATALLASVGSGSSRAIPEDLEQFVSTSGCALDGGDGFRAAAPIVLPAAFSLPAGAPGQVVTAVSWALGQLGTPYSYGGDCTAPRSGDARRQCDCSSLVQMAFKSAGVGLPRTTFEQVRVGRRVDDLAAVRAGDLVFIPGSDGTAASPGHVGLVIGDGLLVQAPHSGAVVRLTRIADWAGVITSVRRVVSW